MKKKLLFLLPFLLFSLAACDLSGLNNNDKDDDEETSENASGEAYVPEEQEQIANKLKEYGKTKGFEITVTAKDDDPENQTDSTATVGMKGNIVWSKDGNNYAGLILGDNNVTVFSTNHDDSAVFDTTVLTEDDLNGKTPEQYYDDFTQSITIWLYTSNIYSSLNLKKVRELTFVGRQATEYSYVESYGPYGVTYKTYIDNELGITLYFFAQAIDVEETTTSEFKVTSFKSGSEVVAPNVQ